jgi:uncharacterized protein YdaU (DUF1376 family)
MARSEIGEWMPFEIDRFFGSPRVQRMKDFQKWWYVSLLLRAWQAEPPCHLPDDQNELMILAGATSEKSWREHSAAVLGMFDAVGNGYRVNRRQLEIYEEKKAVREVNKLNGLKGGRPKKTETKPNGNQTVSDSSSSSSDSGSVAVFDSVPTAVLPMKFAVNAAIDGEQWFDRIMEFWPYKDRDYRVQSAVFDEVERLCSVNKWERVEAITWLIEQLRPIAEVIRKEYPQAKWRLFPLPKVLKQYENGVETFRNFEIAGAGNAPGKQTAGDRFSAALRRANAPHGEQLEKPRS